MKTHYTVRDLAKLSGVSVRTLHHYDEIGLLAPETRSDSGYRLYGQRELLRLQQILFYRELEVPLKEIARIMDDPNFDEREALHGHRNTLQNRQVRLGGLIATIDRTLLKLEGKEMVTDKELYEGFTDEQIKRYEKEVSENYDPGLVAESKKRTKKMSKDQWAAVKKEGESINKELAQALGSGLSPDATEVQALVLRHHRWIENFYSASKEVYLGLGQLYVTNSEFRDHYEKYGTGLADYLNTAIKKYAKGI